MLTRGLSKNRAVHFGVIAAGTLLSYFNALSNGFVWDDIPLIENNPYLKSLAGLGTLFTTGYWASTGSSGGLYRPVTMLSFFIEYSAAGLNPFLYHLDNVIIHLLCGVLVYLIALRLTRTPLAALAAGLLFVTHPVHTEAVAWTSGRSELLSSLFFLGALYTFIRPPRITPWYVISPALLLLGVMSKESAAMLPAVILAYLILFERDGRGSTLRGALKLTLPYVFVIAVYVALRLYFLGGEAMPRGEEQALMNVKGYYAFLTMLRAFFTYIRLLILPVNLHAPYLFAPPESFLNIRVLAFTGIVAGLAALTPRLLRTNRTALFFILWFFITLIPVSNIIPTGIIMSERALYLPSVSFCVLAGMLFARFVHAGEGGRRMAAVGVVLFAVVVGLYTAQSIGRNGVWRDQSTFNDELVSIQRDMLKEFPGSTLVYKLIASTYENTGMYSEAEKALRAAVALDPKDNDARLKLAFAYAKAGGYGEALSDVRTVLESESPLTARNYASISYIMYLAGDYPEAEKYVKKSIGMNPDYGFSHMVYGYILYVRGEYDGALRQHRRATKLNPLLADSWYQIGLILGQREEFAAAADALRNAAAINPEDPGVHMLLGAACLESGRTAEAVRELETALAMRPDYPEAEILLKRARR